MKKIALTTAILVAGTMFVSAETEGQPQQTQGQLPVQAREMIKKQMAQQQAAMGQAMKNIKGENGGMMNGGIPQMPVMTTGDAAVDAQLKALNVEMEAKIKAIRDEYQTKILAIVGTRKVSVGSSTRPMMARDPNNAAMGRGENEDNQGGEQGDRRMGRPMMASTTDGSVPPMPRMRMGEVRGANTEEVGQGVGQDMGSRMKNFFRGFFGN